MKKLLLALLASASLATAGDLYNNETKQWEKDENASWWTDVSISPYAAWRNEGINDSVTFGTGLDIGYAINNTVSLHSLLTSYQDGYDLEHIKTEKGEFSRKVQNDEFGGKLIDEASLVLKADLIKNANERFVVSVLAGGDRNLNDDDWAFGAGAGIALRFSKNISVGGDSRIRAWMHGEKDLLTRGFLTISF